MRLITVCVLALVVVLTACDVFIGATLAPGVPCRERPTAVIDTVGWTRDPATGAPLAPVTTCRARA